MPLLRKWAPSLRASKAVTCKKAGCYNTEVKYPTAKIKPICGTINVQVEQ
jgi:hypothetical protein